MKAPVSQSQDLLAYLSDVSRPPVEDDLPFYGDIAGCANGPAVELGCGTGRVLAVLAASGLSVYGIDAIPVRLWRARRRLGDSASVRLAQGDMRQPNLPRSCGLVILARSVLGYIHHTAEVVAMLRRVRGCLAAEGSVIIDQVNLDGLGKRQQRDSASRWDTTLAGNSSWQGFQEVDRAAGVIRISDVYAVHKPGRGPVHLTEEAVIRIYPLDRLIRAMDRAELRVQGVYGDYGFGPYRPDAERLIVVAGRT